MAIRRGKALFVVKEPIDKTKQAEDFCLQHNLQLEILYELLPHTEFMNKLLTVEWYLDLKGLTSKDVISVSAIEALIQGCKVLTDTGDIVTEFTTSSFYDYLLLYRGYYNEICRSS